MLIMYVHCLEQNLVEYVFSFYRYSRHNVTMLYCLLLSKNPNGNCCPDIITVHYNYNIVSDLFIIDDQIKHDVVCSLEAYFPNISKLERLCFVRQAASILIIQIPEFHIDRRQETGVNSSYITNITCPATCRGLKMFPGMSHCLTSHRRLIRNIILLCLCKKVNNCTVQTHFFLRHFKLSRLWFFIDNKLRYPI